MARNLLGAIVGYAAMVGVALIGITAAWLTLGGAGAFADEGPVPSTAWLAWNLLSGFIAAWVGGSVAVRIGSSLMAVKLLVGVVLVLGVVGAVTNMDPTRAPLEKAVADLTFIEAGAYAVQPGWYNWAMTVIGGIGVWLGGGGTRRA